MVYESESKSGLETECCEPTTIMKLDTLSAILTCATLLLIHGSSRSTVLASPGGDNSSSRRIINGQPANPADFPFLVRLVSYGNLCGGSVISNYWIATASHCILGVECEVIEISSSDWQLGQLPRVHAAQCVTHPQFVLGRYGFDIALIRTAEDVVSYGFGVISLPEPGTTYHPGTPATIVGWGLTVHGVEPQTLQLGQSVLEPWDVCNSQFKESVDGCDVNPNCGDLPNRILCALDRGPAPKSICGGDSGGPFIINGELAGINSAALYDTTGRACIPGTSSLHTRIVDYLPWIYSFVDPSIDTAGFPVAPELGNTMIVGA